MKISESHISCPKPDSVNQDAILPGLWMAGIFWSAIADGVGGNEGGEVASAAVLDALRSSVMGGEQRKFEDIFARARDKLVGLSVDLSLPKLATTMSVIKIEGEVASIGHVGDSRIYHLRNNGIVDRTRDQTEVQHLIEEGILNKAQAKKYARRNVLLSALSPKSEYDLFTQTFSVQVGDRILLVTDGVYKLLLRREIRDLSLQASSPSELIRLLSDEVLRRGVVDDYSAICLQLEAGA